VTACSDLGAVLATVESAYDDTVILNMMAKDTWIGLNDKDVEGTFTWIADSSNLGSYINWYGSNPGSSTVQSCVIKKFLTAGNPNQGQWDDVGCNKDLPYACSMAAVCL